MLMRLYTLSPLHIGTGENLAPLDYLAFDNRFYRLSQKQLFDLIRHNFDGNQGLKDFSSWISQQYVEIAETQDNKRQSILAGNINAYSFFKSKNKDKQLLNYLRENKQLGRRLIVDEKADQYRTDNSPIHKIGEVREAIKIGSNHFVPGTTIKGAIRTALLYQYMSSSMTFQDIKRIIEDQLSRRPKVSAKLLAKTLENNVFFCDYYDNLKDKVRSGEAQMDLLRALHISDAKPVTTGNNFEIAKINLYLVQKNPHPKKRGETILEAFKQQQTSYAEIIPAGTELQFNLQIDGLFLKLLADKVSPEGSIKVGGNNYWLALESKLKGLFGLNLAEIRQLSAQEVEKKAISFILQAVNNFVNKQRTHHQQWLDHFKSYDNAEIYSAKIERGNEPIANCKQTMMRFGSGAGFIATTVLLYFLEDEKRKLLAKNYLETFNIGQKPGSNKRGADNNSAKPFLLNIDRFPKSRKFVEASNTIQPMGWVALLTEEDKELPSLAGIQEERESGDTAVKSILEQTASYSYFKGKINPKKPPILDAQVVESGTPNKVRVFITPEYSPVVQLLSYRTPLTVGVIVEINSQFNNKSELTSASFKKIK